jgi:3-methylcrotonyl-CoA carboxylase alpha subunit
MKKSLLINDRPVDVEILSNNGDEVSFIYEGKTYIRNKNFVEKNVVAANPCFVVNGKEIRVEAKTNGRTKKVFSDHGQMVSPMPGKILKILIAVGVEVIAGTPILVMEAMKMEHTIKASKNGTITKIHFDENSQVSAGVELVTIC